MPRDLCRRLDRVINRIVANSSGLFDLAYFGDYYAGLSDDVFTLASSEGRESYLYQYPGGKGIFPGRRVEIPFTFNGLALASSVSELSRRVVMVS